MTPRSHLAELLQRAARRDEQAWAALVTRFTPRIRTVARGHRLSAQDTDDVVQATWLQLFTHLTSVRDPDRIGAYLHTTARRECLRVLERTPREPAPDAPEPAVAGEADAIVAAHERAAALAAALRDLPPRHAQLMHMLATDTGYTEIAAALHMPIGSIGPTRGRCLRRLAVHPRLAAVAAD